MKGLNHKKNRILFATGAQLTQRRDASLEGCSCNLSEQFMEKSPVDTSRTRCRRSVNMQQMFTHNLNVSMCLYSICESVLYEAGRKQGTLRTDHQLIAGVTYRDGNAE